MAEVLPTVPSSSVPDGINWGFSSLFGSSLANGNEPIEDIADLSRPLSPESMSQHRVASPQLAIDPLLGGVNPPADNDASTSNGKDTADPEIAQDDALGVTVTEVAVPNDAILDNDIFDDAVFDDAALDEDEDASSVGAANEYHATYGDEDGELGFVGPYYHPYELRPCAREVVNGSTWLDKDTSGNYDPDAKELASKPSRKRKHDRRSPQTTEALGERPQKRAKFQSMQAARRSGASFPVTLRYKGGVMKIALSEWEDNWPDEPWNVIALPDPDNIDEVYEGGGLMDLWDDTQPRLLRSRNAAEPNDRAFREYSPIEEKDLVGHPDDPEEHSGPCMQCSEEVDNCVAGPRYRLPGEAPPRIEYGKVYRTQKRKAKPNIKSNGAANGATPGHSSKYSKTKGTASDGKKKKQANFDLDFMASGGRIPHWSELPDEPGDNLPAEDSDSDVGSPEYVEGEQVITTSLCHPIRFGYDEEDEHDGPCHWCTKPQHGILGYGVKTDVHVIEWSPGNYEELFGGHREDNQEQSRICSGCTLARMRICLCDYHDIKPLPSLPKAALDHQEAFNAMLEGRTMSQGSHPVEYRWCSVCPQLAVFECMTQQSRSVTGEEIPPKGKAEFGCGLLLCDACAMDLTQKYEGDLQQMLNRIGNDEEKRPLGLRADVEFLRSDGMLARAITAASE
ncbi:MAG: hypothetical protein M1820_003861 [Bogoriella megaspora]|nr:MAG: hypothetical protein M1820_003861 [Bogoriella megaspora]